ncbi:MAG: Efflux ABC transporter, permease protein [Candidatus Collierbacteria bacterium GW2011_GWE1_46_18]|uniref:Cell division protein FtsX n=1 Tax=Candidatus Collierbacteria bacterium GW2011_GWE1_46_18 TaxID=1618399 RepID=A0A0G1P767_9BACT|nr:MAG: Efflux ABC transporter, permease protein [Candidatus Collierbacteria bacterium GW2011_GWE1_46_18]
MQTAFKNIRRSPYQALSAIFVVSITMFIVAMFALVSVASQEILLTFETKPQIIAYLKDGHTPDQVNELLTQLSTTQGVKKAIYISKQDALELYKESVGNDPMLLGTVTDWGIVTADILPASVEITAQTPKSFNSISSVLERSEIVSTTPQGKKEIDFPQDVVAELTKWTNAIRVAGLIMVAALTLVSILTIVIIISMKISGRKLEITTLKLLGARNFYIIKPYIQESFLYGVSGALIGWLTAYIALLYSTPFLSPRIGTIITFPVPFIIMLILLGGMLTFSAALALVSGFFASTRFVKRSK